MSNSLFWHHMKDPTHPSHRYHSPITQWLFNGMNEKLNNDWEIGKHSAEEVCDIVGRETGIDSNLIFRELITSCQTMTFIDERIPELLKEISTRGIRNVIASDNLDTLRKFTIPAMGLDSLFSDFLISWEIGACKGSGHGIESPFFDTFLEANDLKPSQVILFDDHKPIIRKYSEKGFNCETISPNNTLVQAISRVFDL